MSMMLGGSNARLKSKAKMVSVLKEFRDSNADLIAS
jgi:hypothetical protein